MNDTTLMHIDEIFRANVSDNRGARLLLFHY